MVGPFWWKSILQLKEQYKAMAICNLGDGRSAQFWTNLWSIKILHHEFPYLFTFVHNTSMTVQQVVHTEYLEDLFHSPLSIQAHQQFLQLEDKCHALRQLEYQDCTDTWSYIWCSSVFTSSKSYKVLIVVKQVPPHFAWLWKSSCQPKHKIFSGCFYMIG